AADRARKAQQKKQREPAAQQLKFAKRARSWSDRELSALLHLLAVDPNPGFRCPPNALVVLALDGDRSKVPFAASVTGSG
ncbi:MAG TPA: hypothetical protein VIY29_22925, partial [Ktedonobacteraceae bacterium]